MSNHNKVLIDGNSLTVDQIVAVARNYAFVEISEQAKQNVLRYREYIKKNYLKRRVLEYGKSLAIDAPVAYGINTGFGPFRDITIPKDKLKDLQRNLIMSHSAGVGNYLPVEIVRAIMLVRANTLAKGHSGIKLSTLQTLVDMVNKRVHPAIPEKGSVGASGDLAPLSHLILVLSRPDGNDLEEYSGRVIVEECLDRDNYCVKTISGLRAMEGAGIERVVLDAKEGLALNNGTAVMTAIAALTTYDAERLLNKSVDIFCLTLEALRGCSDAFYEGIHQLRNQYGQMQIAKRIRENVKGSNLLDSRKEVQDSYSIRCFPQVTGAVMDTISYVKNILEREINSVTDNPLIFLNAERENKIFSGGNFHGEPIALACDFLKIALAELGNISERRVFKLTSGHLNNGLPSMLIENKGLNSGFMLLQYTASALASENKVLAHPASIDSIPTGEGLEDHISMGTVSARQAREILGNVQQIIAIELISAMQALYLNKKFILQNENEFIENIEVGERQKELDELIQSILRRKNFGKLREKYKGLEDVSFEELLGKGSFKIFNDAEKYFTFWENDRVAYLDIEKAVELILS